MNRVATGAAVRLAPAGWVALAVVSTVAAGAVAGTALPVLLGTTIDSLAIYQQSLAYAQIFFLWTSQVIH